MLSLLIVRKKIKIKINPLTLIFNAKNNVSVLVL